LVWHLLTCHRVQRVCTPSPIFQLYTHTHTHIYKRTHTHTHTHIHKRAHTIWTRTHTYTHTSRAHTHIRTHRRRFLHIHPQCRMCHVVHFRRTPLHPWAMTSISSCGMREFVTSPPKKLRHTMAKLIAFLSAHTRRSCCYQVIQHASSLWICVCVPASLSVRSHIENMLVRARERRIEYRMAKMRWMSYLHRSFAAKEPIITGSFAERDPQLLRASYASFPPCWMFACLSF